MKTAATGCLALERSKIAIERLSRFRLFSDISYAEMHPDIVGKVDPVIHFIGHGATEGRRAARRTHIARILGSLSRDILPHRDPKEFKSELLDQPLNIGVFVSSLGNAFMTEIAAAIEELLRAAGHNVIKGDENSDIKERPEHCLFIAPHEFFFLGQGTRWVRDDVLATACMYCTEQIQTKWFWQSLPIVLMAKSVVDVSAVTAAAYSEVMPSACISPAVGRKTTPIDPKALTHPLLHGQRWWTEGQYNGDWVNRPLDLCFLGTVSPYRARFFSRHAEKLSHYESFIYLRSGNARVPMNAASDETLLPEVAQLVARNSRILLNIHRDEFPYFEWHRLAYQGMANGCVVVSEPCFNDPEFQSGIHYLTEESHRLPELIDWLLNDPDGKDKASAVVTTTTQALQDTRTEALKAQTFFKILTV
ncbi:hypothetical protein [Methylocella sp. CPCC 101449]|uniref:hypothetical protein n=1 Tax=Methylocella sp. CPCC 101449 TaxID=2987531 RepID=UPI00289092DF|nr:hypothetical protein [Methylocella sp. CPCC 101449]MDT2019457.1 hypothetical protein [Methylocella sp. CPCC 101449]